MSNPITLPEQDANIYQLYTPLNLAGCVIRGNFSTIAYCTAAGGGAYYNATSETLVPDQDTPSYFCALPADKKSSSDLDGLVQGLHNGSDFQFVQCGGTTSAGWRKYGGVFGVGLMAWVLATSVMVAC